MSVLTNKHICDGHATQTKQCLHISKVPFSPKCSDQAPFLQINISAVSETFRTATLLIFVSLHISEFRGSPPESFYRHFNWMESITWSANIESSQAFAQISVPAVNYGLHDKMAKKSCFLRVDL